MFLRNICHGDLVYILGGRSMLVDIYTQDYYMEPGYLVDVHVVSINIHDYYMVPGCMYCKTALL